MAISIQVLYISRFLRIKLMKQTNPNDGFVLERFMSKTLGICVL
jgi:hypothetical protein